MYIIYLHTKLHTEKWIRSRSHEVESYRMLKPVRRQRSSRILDIIHLFYGRLGRSLIALGERLESIGFLSAS